MRARIVAIALAFLAPSMGGCGADRAEADSGASAPTKAPRDPAPDPTKAPSKVAATAPVAPTTRSPFPPFARRTEPPPGIEQSAVAVGAAAPALELARADATRFSLTEARRDGPVVLVFYRGFW